MDLIETVKAENNQTDRILGQGYKDSEIINGSVIREYNTDNIFDRLKANPKVQVYSTWGKGQNLIEWKKEVEKIPNLIPLVSPSMAAKVPKGLKKYDYMLSDWSEKITFVNTVCN